MPLWCEDRKEVAYPLPQCLREGPELVTCTMARGDPREVALGLWAKGTCFLATASYPLEEPQLVDPLVEPW